MTPRRRLPGLPSALAVLALAASVALAPSPAITTSAWAEQHRVVPEPSPLAGAWRNENGPYLVEIMDLMSPTSPETKVTVKKAAQTGVSETAINVVMAYIDLDPCSIMVVHPTVEAAKNWVAEKLEPSIEATAPMRGKVRDATSRSGEGSTAKRKRFLGGYMILTGANSSRELRQRSIRVMVKDDWSDWPREVGEGVGQGDPDRMADARQISYHAIGNYKSLGISTPTIKKACRVSRAYEASDQRRWFVPCPHCDHAQHLHFFPDAEGRGGLRFRDEPPHNAQYACEDCGALIDHRFKREMNRLGRWIATRPGPGRHPGFHISQLISPLTTWDIMVSEFLSSRDDPALMKTFTNLWLGEEYEEAGDAPDWEILKRRAETYDIGSVPAGAYLITIGVDVQMLGLYYEVVAWGPRQESWSIEFGYLEGDTAEDPALGGVWAALTRLYQRQWRLASGAVIQADLLAIDARYRGHQVTGWVRSRPKAMAVLGQRGMQRAVFAKLPVQQERTFRGKTKRYGAAIWPVYVWGLKDVFYQNLRKEPGKAGAETFPPGYCHFSTAHTDEYFQQLTADHKVEEVAAGGDLKIEWKARGPNHWHDCRIYALAAYYRVALKHGVLTNDGRAWSALIAARGGTVRQGELPLDQLASAADMAGLPPSAAQLEPIAADAGDAPPAVRAPARNSLAATPAPTARVVPFAQRRIVRNSLARG